jgi:glycine/D-amino acid oxidase-like deaminating enzyme
VSTPAGSTGSSRSTTDSVSPLAAASSLPLWWDDPARPARRPPLQATVTADLAIVGGGFTGLWAALLALAEEPERSVVVLEGRRLAWAATGRNGGFCSASLTHGVGNGMRRWPAEMPLLQRLGQDNLDAIEATVREHEIDCDFERTGELDVAVAPWQLDGLREAADLLGSLGHEAELLDARQTRTLVDSPTYLGALLDRGAIAMLHPTRLAWGLAQAVERAGGTIFEGTRVTGLRDRGDRVQLTTAALAGGRGELPGAVHARQVVLATNVFPSPLRRTRAYVVPVWDHVIATAPLTTEQLATIGWAGREGVGDSGNRFHYYRLTRDNRIVFGGYDALYYYGSGMGERRSRRAGSEQMLYDHLVTTFPALDGISVTHTWGGAIDTSPRFCASWHRACTGKVVSVLGFTGLGVGASRFGAQVCLDLLAGRDNERTRLAMVRRTAVPWPPEPLRWLGIEATKRSIARADSHDGRRDLWLRTLDRFGLGFDS